MSAGPGWQQLDLPDPIAPLIGTNKTFTHQFGKALVQITYWI